MKFHPFVAVAGLVVMLGSVEVQAHNSNSLRGAVVDADGTMVSKFIVVVRPLDNKPVMIERKRFSNGIFIIEHLDRQKYEISISAPKYIGERMNVEFPKNGGSTDLKFIVLHPVLNEKYFPGNSDADYDIHPSDYYVPEIAKENYRQGLNLHREGQLENALAAYGNAIRLAPNYVAPLIGIGIIYQALNRQEAALVFLKRAEELAPKDPAIRLNIVLVLVVKNDFRPAMKMLESMAKEDPGNTVPYLLMARVYAIQKKYVQAEKMVRFALQLDPGLIEARQLLLNMALEQKNYAVARENLLRLRDMLNNELLSGFVEEQIAKLTSH